MSSDPARTVDSGSPRSAAEKGSPSPADPPRRPWWARLGRWLVIVLVTYLISCGLAALAVPLVLDKVVMPRLGETLGRQVVAERFRFNPFTLVLDVKGLRIAGQDPASDFVTVDTLRADLSIGSLRYLAPVFDALRIERPRVRIERVAKDRFDFSDIVERLEARSAAAEPAPDEGPARFALRDFELVDGEITLDDRTLGQQHRITELAIGVPLVSNLDHAVGVPVEPRLSARIDGSPLSVAGRTLPFDATRDTAMEVTLDDLDIGMYLRLSPVPLAFTVPAGRLGARLGIEFAQDAGNTRLAISGSTHVDGLQLEAAAGGRLVQVQRIDLGLDRVEPLAGSYAFGELAIAAPEVKVARRADGSLPIARAFTVDSAPADAAADPAAEQAGAEPHWSVRSVRVTDGRVDYADAAVSPAVSLVQSGIAIQTAEIGNRQARPAAATLSFVQGESSKLDWKGELDLARSQAVGRLEARVASIAPYAPYLASALPAKLEAGPVSLQGRLALDWSRGFGLEASEAAASIAGASLRLPDAKEPAITLDRLAADGVTVSLGERKVGIGRLALAGANVSVVRDAKGTIDLARIAGDRAGAGEGRGDVRSNGQDAAWSVLVERMDLERNAVRFRDLGAARPVEIPVTQIAGHIERIGTDLSGDSRVDVQAKVGAAGTVSARGGFVASPLALQLTVQLQRFALASVDPYVAEFLALSLDEGTAGTRGEVRLEKGRLRYQGRLDVDGLRSRERTSGTETIRWGKLAVDGIDLDLDPARMGPSDRVTVGGVTLSDFFARVLLDSQGRFNLQDIFLTEASAEARKRAEARGSEAPEAPAATAPPADAGEGGPPVVQERPAARRTAPATGATGTPGAGKPGPSVHLGGVRLVRGRSNFTDRFIRPNYSVNLTDLEGTLSAMATDSATPADVALRGRIDGDASVDISGRIQPLGPSLFADIRAQAKGIDLPTLSPYSAKYAGYAIEKGQLSVDVRYHVENEQLEAENRIFLDQLTFGEKVDSPDAIDLPIQFAVGLLKNSKGEIDLNLPISGSLDDPQFSIGSVIAKAVANLLTRIVTAPFSALAAAFGGAGGGEELSFVEFGPGTAELTEGSVERLRTIAKALAERPALKLEIAGRVDPQAERDAIRRERLDAQLRALKRRQQDGGQERGERAQGAGRVAVTREEYPVLLRKLYESREEGGAQAEGSAQAPGTPPAPPPPAAGGAQPQAGAQPPSAGRASDAGKPDVAEMERRLLEAIPVDAESVRRLANRRADAARNWLVAQGKIDRGRMFLLAPRTSPSAVGPNRTEPQCPARCAEFSLR